MEKSVKRPAESSEESQNTRKSLRGSNVEARRSDEPDAPEPKQLPDLKPFDIVENIVCPLPSQVLDASPGFSRAKYTRDVWTVFSSEALNDPKLAEMHQMWLKCRQPDIRLLWESRYPPKGVEHQVFGSSRNQVLRTVLTLETIIEQVPSEQLPELHRSFSELYLDYIMLMGVVCLRSKYLVEARQYFPTYEQQFDEVAQFLQLRLPQESIPSSNQAARQAAIPQENQAIVEGLLVDPTTVKSLGQIAGCKAAKTKLEGAAYIYSELPHLIKEGYGCKNILLHGSPGTGKSTLAQAVAVESKMPCYNVSASHLINKWMGASEKNVRFLFEIANAHVPSAIILDEIDAIGGARNSMATDGAQRMASELMTCMSRFPKVTVIGTTTLPWTLDVALIYRFQNHIFVELPSEADRNDLITNLIVRHPHSLKIADIARIAKKTDGFTGEAIERCIQDVADQMALELRNVKYFQQMSHNGQQRYSPASPTSKAPQIPREKISDRALIIPGPFGLQELLAVVEEVTSERGLMTDAEEKHARWNKEKFIEN